MARFSAWSALHGTTACEAPQQGAAVATITVRVDRLGRFERTIGVMGDCPGLLSTWTVASRLSRKPHFRRKIFFCFLTFVVPRGDKTLLGAADGHSIRCQSARLERRSGTVQAGCGCALGLHERRRHRALSRCVLAALG